MQNILKKQENYLKLIVDNTAEGVEVQKINSSKKTTLASIDKNISDLHLTIYEQLDSVIENLKSINDSIIESFIAVDDIKKSLNSAINPLVQKSESSQNTSRINQGLSDEEKTEAVRREETLVKEQTAQTELLKKILNALSPTAKKDTPEIPGINPLAAIGTIGTGLAIALGAVAGYIKGYVKILQAIGKGLYKALDYLSGGRITKALDAFSTKLVTLIDDLYLFMSKQFIRIQKFFSGFGLRIMTFFDDIILKLPPSIAKPILEIPKKIADFLQDFKNLFTVLGETSKPFVSIVEFFKDVATKVKTFFTSVKSYFDDFFKIVGKVMPIFEKLALPLTVIMAIWDTVKGAVKGFEEEGIVGAIKGAITGLFNSIIGGVLDLVKSAISWVAGALGFKSVEKALDSFSFQDIFKKVVDSVFSFFGSIIDWIKNPFENFSLGAMFGTLPDLLKGAISWVAGKLGFSELEKLLDSFSITNLFDDAIKVISGSISSIVNNFIVDPIKSLFNKITSLIEEYIAKPLQTFFSPLVNFFKDIPTKLANIFEDVGVPEIKYKIPVINKEISIGPFYPFRPEKEVTRISTNQELKQTSSSSGASSEFKENTVTSGTYFKQDGKLSEDETLVLTQSEKANEKTATFATALARFDPRTGKSTLSRTNDDIEEYDREISKRAFNRIKKNAIAGGDTSDVDAIIKEDEIYQKLDWFDKRKVDFGFAKAEDLIKSDKYQSTDKNTLSKDSGIFGNMFDKAKGIWDSIDIKGAFESVSGIANEYIIDPVKSLFEKITSLIEEYITKPLQTFFAPLVDFFKAIPTQLAGIFEYVGIPEIKYKIPVINKEISIGPFYPFRPEKDVSKLSSKTSLETSRTTDRETGVESSQRVLKKSISEVEEDKSRLIQSERVTSDGVRTERKVSGTFDTQTGTSSVRVDKESAETLKAAGLSVDETGSVQVSNRAFRLLKNRSDKGGTIADSMEIIKEDADYQKLNWFDKRKVDVGYARASELIKDPKYQNVTPAGVAPNRELSTNVYDRTIRNEGMKAAATGQTAPVIVNAATTNVANNKQNVTLPVPTRNQDPSVQSYITRKNVLI